ncbi:alpha/beta hydrolase [Algoriphagus sp.]|uniref:alpha/beta hydrolase n=1 Tax=Algoriphagus sp. TaxID=1872435 RepID=UPI00391C862C
MTKKFFPSYIGNVGKAINAVHKVNPLTACKLTMGVLSLSLRGKIRNEERAFYQSGIAQLHHCEKHKFYTFTFGEGPPILLLHGWCSRGARWMDYVQELVCQGFQVVVMDAPGHGTSPGYTLSVPHYIKCVGQVLQTRSRWHAIVSHSMGSLVGVIAASESSSEQFAKSKFVLMSTFSNCDALMSKFSRCLGISEKVLEDTRNWIPDYSGRPLSYFSINNHISRFDEPEVLLIADREDIVVPTTEANLILESIPKAASLFTHGLGHNLRCDNVRKVVIDFLQS